MVTLVPYGRLGVNVMRTQSSYLCDNEKEKEKDMEKDMEKEKDMRSSGELGLMCSLSDVIQYCTEKYSRSRGSPSVTPLGCPSKGRAGSSSVTVPTLEARSNEGCRGADGHSARSPPLSPFRPLHIGSEPADGAGRLKGTTPIPSSPSAHVTLPSFSTSVAVSALHTPHSNVYGIVSPIIAANERKQEQAQFFTSPAGVTVDAGTAMRTLRQVCDAIPSCAMQSCHILCCARL